MLFFGRWCLQRWRLLLPLKRVKWYLGRPGESRRIFGSEVLTCKKDWDGLRLLDLGWRFWYGFVILETGGCFSQEYNFSDFMSEIQRKKEVSKHGETVGRSPTKICRPLSLKSAAYAKMELYNKVQWRPVRDKYQFFGFCSGWWHHATIQTVKLCPNVVCWFYSKNGLSRACSRKIFKDLVEGACFETVFYTSCKAHIILSKPLYNQTPRPEGIKWGVVCKGILRNKNGDCRFWLVSYFSLYPCLPSCIDTNFPTQWYDCLPTWTMVDYFSKATWISLIVQRPVGRISGYSGEAWPISGRANRWSWGKTRSFSGRKVTHFWCLEDLRVVDCFERIGSLQHFMTSSWRFVTCVRFFQSWRRNGCMLMYPCRKRCCNLSYPLWWQ